MNERVYTALSLYAESLRGQEKARLGDEALGQMGGFRRIVKGRVDGGVSDKGDLLMVDTKIETRRTMRETATESAARQVDEAREDSARSESRPRGQIASLERQRAESERLAREGAQTYRLFEAQFRAGQRSVLEVVDTYEQSVNRRLDVIEAKFNAPISQLQLARDLGLLADGDAI